MNPDVCLQGALGRETLATDLTREGFLPWREERKRVQETDYSL